MVRICDTIGMNMPQERAQKAWVVAVDMGYGHQRAASALLRFAFKGRIITANSYPGIPVLDKLIWQEIRQLYELISRFKKVPVLGDFVFSIFDKFQKIKEFYLRNQAVDATLQLQQIYGLLERRKWGRHLIETLNANPLPLVTTFSVVAFMAEYWKYKGPILLVETDADIARSWVPLHPSTSKIIYCAPTLRVVERLKSYGVSPRQIFLTGFPLPEELLGRDLSRAKANLKRRLVRLDPQRRYLTQYADVAKRYLGTIPAIPQKPSPLLLTFSIGGAGAQQELAEEIIHYGAELLKKDVLRLCIVTGTNKKIARVLESSAKKEGLQDLLGKELQIFWFQTKGEYFKKFGNILEKTDILWTKPSELSFYGALGIPILIAPPIGTQEVQNRKWLLYVGVGIDQHFPKFISPWFTDFLHDGVFAEAAMQGFVEIEKEGVKNIGKLLSQASSGHRA